MKKVREDKDWESMKDTQSFLRSSVTSNSLQDSASLDAALPLYEMVAAMLLWPQPRSSVWWHTELQMIFFKQRQLHPPCLRAALCLCLQCQHCTLLSSKLPLWWHLTWRGKFVPPLCSLYTLSKRRSCFKILMAYFFTTFSLLHGK